MDLYYVEKEPVLIINPLGDVEIKNGKRYNKYQLLLENHYLNIKEEFLFSFEDDIFALNGFVNSDLIIDTNGDCHYEDRYPFFYKSTKFEDIINVMELYEATEIVINLFKDSWENAINRQTG